MPLSDYDHIEALRSRLLQLKQQKNAEIIEIDEAMRALGLAPKLLSGQAPHASKPVEQRTQERSAKRNIGLTDKLKEYVATSNPGHIVVADIIAWLTERGVTGKRRSLDSAVRIFLNREAEAGHLHYIKGEGYFKGEPKSRLVYTEDEEHRPIIDKDVTE